MAARAYPYDYQGNPYDHQGIPTGRPDQENPIVVTYDFVWTEVPVDGTRQGHQSGNGMRIRNSKDEQETDGT